MEFRWFCRQTTESYPLDSDDPNKLLYKNGDFIPETKRKQEEIDLNKNELGISFQNGGCFGNGPGKI
jgi:hypothetical protein